MTLELLLLGTGFAVLIKGATLLVANASRLAQRWGVSPVVIGLTVVAFGTSAPELAINLMAAAAGSTDIALGNIVGSTIANLFLILGAAACLRPLVMKRATVWRELPLALAAAVAVFMLLNDIVINDTPAAALTSRDGLVLLLVYGLFLYFTNSFNSQAHRTRRTATSPSLTLTVALAAAGLFAITMGSRLVVDNAAALAEGFGVSHALIGLTIVALGTTLPEIATVAVAVYKRQADLAIGNVIGAILFNLLVTLPLTSFVAPLPTSSAINFDLGVAIIALLLTFLALFTGQRHTLKRRHGASFVILYVLYLAFALWRG